MGSPLLTLAPYSEIATKVAGRLAGSRDRCDPLSPWSEEVIVASSGVAQAIGARSAERGAQGVAGLQLRSIENFARAVLNAAGEFPRVASDAERRLAMRTAARSLDDPLTATRGAAAMLERSYRDVRDSGMTLADFTRRAGSAPLRNRDRIRIVIRAWQEYEKLIAKVEAVDPADVLARAAILIRAPRSALRDQIVAGFYDLTGAQLALVRALQSVEKLTAV
ncbi:MAG TPA: hypothetical protein VF980_01460, partial [Thermoanaerobaculia bacterium]